MIYSSYERRGGIDAGSLIIESNFEISCSKCSHLNSYQLILWHNSTFYPKNQLWSGAVRVWSSFITARYSSIACCDWSIVPAMFKWVWTIPYSFLQFSLFTPFFVLFWTLFWAYSNSFAFIRKCGANKVMRHRKISSSFLSRPTRWRSRVFVRKMLSRLVPILKGQDVSIPSERNSPLLLGTLKHCYTYHWLRKHELVCIVTFEVILSSVNGIAISAHCDGELR